MRENKQHTIEVHVAGICFNSKNEVLLLKRSQTRKLYPGFWECGGGQVYNGENFEEAIIRQIKEEASIIIKPLKVIGVYEINIPNDLQKKIPGIKFACKFLNYINNNIQISSEHDDWRWQPINQLDEFKFIPGIKEDIKIAYQYITST